MVSVWPSSQTVPTSTSMIPTTSQALAPRRWSQGGAEPGAVPSMGHSLPQPAAGSVRPIG